MPFSELSGSLKFLPVDFVVAGGGLAGLTAAIALVRAGHRVTVLDEGTDFDNTEFAAGARVPANITKVWYNWGLKEELKKIGVTLHKLQFSSYYTGNTTATGIWNQDFKEESGGAEPLSLDYSDLRKLLHDAAVKRGAKVRGGCKVVAVSVTPERPSVTLESGEKVSGDVLVFADGRDSFSREIILGDKQYRKFKKTIAFNALVPFDKMAEDSDLTPFICKSADSGIQIAWFGEAHGVMGLCTGRREFCLTAYTPWDQDFDRGLLNLDKEHLIKSLSDAEPRLQRLSKLATKVVGIPVIERPHLDNWVHPDGPMVVIGEAAHPITAGSVYALGLAAGDGIMLGGLFKYLSRKDQIRDMLDALSERRRKRVTSVEMTARMNPLSVALPPGVEGARYLTTTAENMSHEMLYSYAEEALRLLWAHDPEEEADEWWAEWGVLQMRAARMTITDSDKE